MFKLMKALCAVALSASLLAGCQSRDDDFSSSSGLFSSSMPSSSSSAPSLDESSMPESSMPESSASSLPAESLPMESSGAAGEPAAPAGSADFSQIAALDGTKVQWGPGRQVNEENRPTAPIGLQEKYGAYGCEFIGDAGEKKIYLTFDQGYENGYTTPILDTLKSKNVPAVFFLTGHYVRTQPELVQRMIDEGHVLGNHSNNHYDYTEVPLETAHTDLVELRDIVLEQFNYECTLFRFPEGYFSEQSLALVRQDGCVPVFWSFAYADWDPNNQMSEEKALSELTSRLHNGGIYLLHSVSSTNAAVLGRFIDEARAQGYAFSVFEA